MVWRFPYRAITVSIASMNVAIAKEEKNVMNMPRAKKVLLYFWEVLLLSVSDRYFSCN